MRILTVWFTVLLLGVMPAAVEAKVSGGRAAPSAGRSVSVPRTSPGAKPSVAPRMVTTSSPYSTPSSGVLTPFNLWMFWLICCSHSASGKAMTYEEYKYRQFGETFKEPQIP